MVNFFFIENKNIIWDVKITFYEVLAMVNAIKISTYYNTDFLGISMNSSQMSAQIRTPTKTFFANMAQEVFNFFMHSFHVQFESTAYSKNFFTNIAWKFFDFFMHSFLMGEEVSTINKIFFNIYRM